VLYRLLLAVCVYVLAMLLSATSLAEERTSAAEAGATGAAEVTGKDGLEDLIMLLESPTAREDFLQKVKALEEARDAVVSDSGLDISDALELDEKVGGFMNEYISMFTGSELRNGRLGKLVMVFIISVVSIFLVLANNWLARTLDRNLKAFRSRMHVDANRFSTVFTWQRYAVAILIGLAWFYAVVVVLFDRTPGAAAGDMMGTVMQTAVAVLLVALIFLLIWETINALLESMAERQDALNSRRARTLLPVVRNVLTFVLMLLSSLVILSELGVDVVPLLAGAGVVGVAVGFGAQTLVRDFLTGFTIIIEDLLQIGDVVAVAGRQGFVTHISMRKLELRSLEGTVHTIPFSAIDIVDNLTKDYSYYMLDVGVAYREDIDEVIACLQDIDKDLRESEEFGHDILEPLDVLGVDEFADSAVVIKARTKTSPREKWRIGREFNRRIKIAFDERDIEIPFPHQTLYFGVDKDGGAPPLPPDRHRDGGDEG